MSMIVWGKTVAHSSNQHVRLARGAEADEGVVIASVILGLLLTWSSTTMADDAGIDEPVLFDIPQLRADQALTRFAEQADLTLIFPFDEVREKIANRLIGKYAKEEAVEVLLAGTGLKPTFSDRAVLRIALDYHPEPGGGQNEYQ